MLIGFFVDEINEEEDVEAKFPELFDFTSSTLFELFIFWVGFGNGGLVGGRGLVCVVVVV